MLWSPLFSQFDPSRILTFRFPAQAYRRIRLIQTASPRDAQWAVNELRAFNGTSEIPRAPAWRLTAQPNPWDVQLAFDNSPATRWRTWEEAKPGMFLDVDFGNVQTIDSVVVETTPDTDATRVKLDAMTPDGKWITVETQPQESSVPVRVSLRRAATYELKARGIRYLLVSNDDLGTADFRLYQSAWGIQCIWQGRNSRLYYIE